MYVFLLSVISAPHDLESLTCFLTVFDCAVYDTLMCNLTHFAACSQLQSVLQLVTYIHINILFDRLRNDTKINTVTSRSHLLMLTSRAINMVVTFQLWIVVVSYHIQLGDTSLTTYSTTNYL